MEAEEKGLRERIRALVRERETTRTWRRTERDQKMAELEERIARFGEMQARWTEEVVLPKLQALAESFPNTRRLVCREADGCTSVVFEPTHEYPIEAKVGVWTSADPDALRARTTFRVTIVPILGDFDREGILEIDLDRPDVAEMSRFLDERVLRFVADYLDTLEPDSPYQRDARVTDPVCGMTLLRAEARSTRQYEGRTWYFCVEACRRKFEADPERYARPPART